MDYDIAIIGVGKLLQRHFPSVLSTMITDYCYPTFKQVTLGCRLDVSNRLKELPSVDMIWLEIQEQINFYRTNGTALGYITMEGSQDFRSIRLVQADTNFFFLRSRPYSNGLAWEVRTFAIICSSVEVGMIEMLSTSSSAVFRSDNDRLSIVDNDNYYIYDGYQKQVIFDIKMKIIDIARVNNQYFVVGVHRNTNVVAIYDIKKDGAVFHRSFEIQQLHCPKLLTVAKDSIIVLFGERKTSLIESYSFDGNFLNRTQWSGGWDRPNQLRVSGQYLFLDERPGCSVLKQVWN